MRVLIAGGGNVGSYIATELSELGHSATVVEIDPARIDAAASAGLAEGIEWILADACEVSELLKADPGTADIMVAVTGDDEDNLVISLLSKQEFAVPRVIARVNNPNNEWLFNESWGVDLAVSTPHLLTGLVEEAVSVGSLVRLLALRGGRVRLAEVTLAPSSPAIGKEIAGLGFPRDSMVVAVIRASDIIVPRGDTVLYDGDEVVVIESVDSEEEVRRLLVG